MRHDLEVGELIPCLRNADHAVPRGAQRFEVECCAGCGHDFLRPPHDPSEYEMDLLAILPFVEDSKAYARLKLELLHLRGSRYCGACRMAFQPVADRIQFAPAS